MAKLEDSTSASIIAPSPSSSVFSALSSSDLDYADNVLQWSAQSVSVWLANVGFSQYTQAFVDNNISGDVLPYISNTDLKDIGVRSISHRLAILKQTNDLLSAYNIHPDPYLLRNSSSSSLFSAPGLNNNTSSTGTLTTSTSIESTVSSFISEKISNDMTKLQRQLTAKDRSLVVTNKELKKLTDNFNRLREELLPVFKIVKDSKPLPTPDHLHSNFPLSPSLSMYSRISPTKSTNNLSASNASISRKYSKKKGVSPTDPDFLQNQLLSSNSSSSTLLAGVHKNSFVTSPTSPSRSQASTPSTYQAPRNEPLKQLRASKDDSCNKVLQAAMRRHRINDDSRQYALVICYGDQERILGLDEKPVVIFKELQDQGKHPSIMLRQMEGIQYEQGVIINGTPGGKL